MFRQLLQEHKLDLDTLGIKKKQKRPKDHKGDVDADDMNDGENKENCKLCFF